MEYGNQKYRKIIEEYKKINRFFWQHEQGEQNVIISKKQVVQKI